MVFSHYSFPCFILIAALLPGLSACENRSVGVPIEGRDHSLALIREQKAFWSDEVEQRIVVSRLPDCVRRVSIHPTSTAMPPLEIYEAGFHLWALFQSGRWYLASTDDCKVQDWPNPDGRPPGTHFGRFEQKGDDLVFTAVSGATAPALP